MRKDLQQTEPPGWPRFGQGFAGLGERWLGEAALGPGGALEGLAGARSGLGLLARAVGWDCCAMRRSRPSLPMPTVWRGFARQGPALGWVQGRRPATFREGWTGLWISPTDPAQALATGLGAKTGPSCPFPPKLLGGKELVVHPVNS